MHSQNICSERAYAQVVLANGCDGVLLSDGSDKILLDDGSDKVTFDDGSDGSAP